MAAHLAVRGSRSRLRRSWIGSSWGSGRRSQSPVRRISEQGCADCTSLATELSRHERRRYAFIEPVPQTAPPTVDTGHEHVDRVNEAAGEHDSVRVKRIDDVDKPDGCPASVLVESFSRLERALSNGRDEIFARHPTTRCVMQPTFTETSLRSEAQRRTGREPFPAPSLTARAVGSARIDDRVTKFTRKSSCAED